MRTLIAYIGDNPAREGLLDTPKRVVGAYEELYRGYGECPAETLERTVLRNRQVRRPRAGEGHLASTPPASIT